MQENKEIKEISFKDRLIQIYTELDNIKIDEVQNEINEIKSNLHVLIEDCKKAEEEKEKILFDELLENKSNYHPLQKCYKTEKPIIIQKPKEEKELSTRKDWLFIGILLAIIAALCVCIITIA